MSQRIVEYSFEQGYRCAWLESILKEFQIETKESWQRIVDIDDWMYQANIIFKEPDYPEFYTITYTCLPEVGNLNHEFADMLIEAMLSTVGYLEGCFKKEIEIK